MSRRQVKSTTEENVQMSIQKALKAAWNVLVNGHSLTPNPSNEQKQSLSIQQLQELMKPQRAQSGKQKPEVWVAIDAPKMPVDARQIPQVLEMYSDLMSRYIFKRVRDAIINNQPVAYLFYSSDSKHIAQVAEADYEANLADLRNHFIKNERYEHVQECDRILRKHLANKLIAETRHRA